MKTIHFNTGRSYTQHGQRITATLHDDGVVTFFDHDRMIDGEFRLRQHIRLSQEEVMTMYDNHQARNTTRSWEDGMQRDGCNTKYEG